MIGFGGTLGKGAALSVALLSTILMAPKVEAQGSNRDNTAVQCANTVLHFARSGFAFECTDTSGMTRHLFVVSDGDYDRIEAVIDILRDQNERSAPSTRRRTTRGLWVDYATADAAAQSVCNEVKPRNGTPTCFVAVDIAYK